MTIAELKTKYTEAELCSYPGDDALRFAAFAPLFQDLHNNSLVYREKSFYAIVSVTDLALTPKTLSGTAEITKKIERPYRETRYPEKSWRFCCNWGGLMLINRAISAPYVSFTLWPEAALVAEVERLVDEGKSVEAYELLRK